MAAPARKSKGNSPRPSRSSGGSRRSGGSARAFGAAIVALFIVAGGVYWFARPQSTTTADRAVPTPPTKPAAAESAPTHQATRSLHADAPAEPPKPAAKPARKELAAVSPGDVGIDRWFMKAYLRCWSPPGKLPDGDYAAKVRVTHDSNGGLAGAPVLVNPPSDPDWRPYADSAVQAVKKCNPLHVPSDFAGRFDEWKKVTLYFAPDSARE